MLSADAAVGRRGRHLTVGTRASPARAGHIAESVETPARAGGPRGSTTDVASPPEARLRFDCSKRKFPGKSQIPSLTSVFSSSAAYYVCVLCKIEVYG